MLYPKHSDGKLPLLTRFTRGLGSAEEGTRTLMPCGARS